MANMRTAQDLLAELNAPDELPCIEAKRSREMGKSVMETVIAFANEPGLGGGHLLLGANWAVAAKGRHPAHGKLPLEGGKRSLPPLPPELTAKLLAPGQRMGEAALRQLIRDLCGWQALRGEKPATLLSKDLKYLRHKHLSAMVQAGELVFQFPESPNHPLQAYQLPKSN